MGIVKKVSNFLDVIKKVTIYAKAVVSAMNAFTTVLEENGLGVEQSASVQPIKEIVDEN